MKLQITHLKAPWPEGAVVGDVLDLPEVPVWALGKCKQAEDDAPVFVVNPKEENSDDASIAESWLSAGSEGTEAGAAATSEEAMTVKPKRKK